VCIFLAEESGKVIREVEESGVLQTMSKTDASPVTIADIKVQKTIEECLSTLYPALNIQGEESKESTDKVDAALKPDKITQ
jgi:3'-phosphoadenosine 5'-phosphosulfate (PAPS) 3'-phosphatase